MRRSAFGAFAFALLQLVAASCSLADDASVTTIDGTAGVRATGIVQVNVAAGNGNSASNVVAIGGVPVTKSRKPECVCATSTATASIGGDAFSRATGVPGDAYGFSIGTAFALNERSNLSLSFQDTFQHETRLHPDLGSWSNVVGSATNAATLDIGTTYVFDRRSSVQAQLGFGMTQDAPNYQFSLRFPRKF